MGSPKDGLWLLLLCCTLITSSFPKYSIAADSIIPTQSINGSQTIVSSGQIFELGFFTPRNSNNNSYLAIWYKNIPTTVVWVANRDNPLTISSGILTIGGDGNLVLLDQSGSSVWSSNSSRAAKNPVAQLLDSGNLVLKDVGDGNFSENIIWQSFDYPSDTLLPGMKLGRNLKTGLNRILTSWKTSDDPSSGDYTYMVDLRGLPQLVLHKGSVLEYRSRPWYGGEFSGGPVGEINPVFRPTFVSNANEVYYTYEIIDNITSRFVLGQTGKVQHFSWNEGQSSWTLIATVQGDRCEDYAQCGRFGSCNINSTVICRCLKGFEPKLPQDWKLFDWLGGCVRKDPRVCRSGEGFMKVPGLKLPDASVVQVNVNLSIEECQAECLKNCSCLAYARLDFSGNGGNGCITWSGVLIDIKEVDDYGQDLYVRVAASELGSNGGRNKKRVAIIVVFSVVSVVILLASISWVVNRKKRRERASRPVTTRSGESQDDGLELPLFELTTVKAATNNFSSVNKIGEGGFGPVYKGVLPSGQEVAIKRLSENSGQGPQEFKNEVIFISKLQHRNLVKLLGCCIQGQERMLIYEYMPNRSLDFIIFDETRRRLLNWQTRLDIIVGIARGLVYLHRDSRLRIIHRDLKASNILLDMEMNPKISDFGLARMFGGDQTEANTKRVVGTYGYMAPEYAIEGQFSMKSDVFSFGVLLLEIVRGQKNRGFFHPDHKHNLLGHAWKLWNEEKALKFVDALLENEFPVPEAIRCIQVGLLCVQQRPEERPTMPSVLLMLDSENSLLPQPGRPGFYEERILSEKGSSSMGELVSTSNEMSVALL